ncbi:MAG: P-loop NTPase fold protein [Candidatus Omnitrophota bacterium]
MAINQPPEIFISYSDKDKRWQKVLVKHFKTLEEEGFAKITSNQLRKPNVLFPIRSTPPLHNVKIFIFLVSRECLAAFDISPEIPQIRERYRKGDSIIVPLIIKQCEWREIDWLPPMQAFPQNGRLLSSYTGNHINEPLVEFVKYIKFILKQQTERKYWRVIPDLETIKASVNGAKLEKKNETAIDSWAFEIPLTFNVNDRNHDPVIGVEELAQELAEILSNKEGDDATMVGLFGRWGRGKTFLMEQIWEQLNPDNKIKDKEDKNNGKEIEFERVDFHAWKFQETPASWAYLYQSFSDEYFKKPKKDWKYYLWKWVPAKFRNFYKIFLLNKTANGCTPIVLFGLSILSALSLAISDKSLVSVLLLAIFDKSLEFKIFFIPFDFYISFFTTLPGLALIPKAIRSHSKSAIDLFNKYTKKKNYHQLLGFQKEIQDALKILLKVWIPEKNIQNKRILLFVDDLDRCGEERLIQVIDSLRVLLEEKEISKRVIALVAVDERILAHAINYKYQKIISKDERLEQVDIPSLTHEYLDKLFLLGVKLNPLNNEEKEEILHSITKNSIAPDKSIPSHSAINTGDEEIESLKKHEKEEPKPDEHISEIPLTEKSFKIRLNLFNNKEIKKYKPISIKWKNYKEPIDYQTLIKCFDSQEIPEEVLKKFVFEPELNKDERNQISDLLHLLENATPRSIRILYYQYILAKRLLKAEIPHYETNKVDQPGANALLDFLILAHQHRSCGNENRFSECLSQKGAKEKTKIKEIIDRIETLDSEILFRLKSVIDTVVAY